MGIPKDDILWIGTQGEIEESLVPKNGLRLETIVGGAVVGVPWRERLVNITKLAWSLGKASSIIGRFKPDVLFMTGGYVNAPVATAAWLRRVPSVIYLPDIEPGMSIRELSRFAKRVACTAETSISFFKPGKGIVTGYPVRRSLRAAKALTKDEALAQFNLKRERPTLFVFGGSRGARSINRALLGGLPKLLDQIQVIHVSGR
jgi:UDP-N-acetylglucosamine--N-acetylmuramyl-(pentapeptide) pyrophosphoryl-undecaprenol N-acetylglucosamine transferase